MWQNFENVGSSVNVQQTIYIVASLLQLWLLIAALLTFIQYTSSYARGLDPFFRLCVMYRRRRRRRRRNLFGSNN